MILRLAAATILGALIGVERERVESTVGLRTHAIVALGAAMFMLVSMFGFHNAGGPPGVVLDPSRVAAQIVSGIGFIGAGVIIFRKEVVRGLTTAASVWLVAAIGMAVAGGLYLPALGTTAFGLGILAAMKPLERRLGAARRPQLLAIVFDRRRTSLTAVKSGLARFGVTLERADVRVNDDPAKTRLEIAVKRLSNDRLFALLDLLPNEPGIREVRSLFTFSATPKRALPLRPKGRRLSAKRALPPIVVALSVLCSRPLAAEPLRAAEHGDFSYYTFALTWQPGICGSAAGCRDDQPKDVLIGLHGLWASLPQSLINEGVVPQRWWQRGCDYFRHSDAAPVLDRALEAELEAVMPHFAHSLLTHEFDKHVQCFGFDPDRFFNTELAMRRAVVDSPFGSFLIARTGQRVAHADINAAFGAAFETPATAALQLQCAHDAAGRAVLTQLWISVPAGRLGDFPRSDSLIDAPIAQDNCPPALYVPDWTAAPA